MNGFRTALSFLTRVPVPHRDVTPADLAAAVGWFPAVGIVVGALTGITYAAAAQILPWTAAAVLAVIVGALLTGGFHEDGLGDTADAFGGGWSAEDVHRILKDSRQGTYGVLAIAAALIAKVSLLDVLGPWAGALALVATHAGGRAIAVGLMGAGEPAPSSDGLGAAYLRALAPGQVRVAVIVGTVTVTVILGVWVLGVILGGALVIAALLRMSRRRLGGLVGDVLGAAEQLGELVVLAAAASVVSRNWPGFEPFAGSGWWAGLMGRAVWP